MLKSEALAGLVHLTHCTPGLRLCSSSSGPQSCNRIDASAQVQYFVIYHVTLTFDPKRLLYIGCDMIKLCTKLYGSEVKQLAA